MKLLFILLSCCLLFACTITKRHFGAGYHVEWKRNHLIEKKSDSDNTILLENDFSSDEESVVSNTWIIENRTTKDTIVSDLPKPIDDKLIAPQGKEHKEINFTPQSRREQNQLMKSATEEKIIENQDVVQEEPKKVEKFTWFALGSLGLISLLLMIFSLIGVFSSFSGIVLVIFGLLLMIFSIVSVIRIRKNPDRYKAKWLTWTLLGVGTVGIGALLFMVVYYLLIITNNVDLL